MWESRVFCACLFLSGAAGLGYEVLWSRLLIQSFGNTLSAVTIVLSVFMGGLALGSRLFGRLADRTKRPLRLYACLEIGIGAYCLAVPSLLSFARHLYLTHLVPLSGSFPWRTFSQFLLTSMVLLAPTVLMGGTLPAVIRGTAKEPGDVTRNVGRYYGWNTLGAAAGAFAVGYFFIPALGIRGTNLLAVAGNFLSGAAVLLIAPGTFGIPPGGPHPAETTDRGTFVRPGAYHLAIAISGALGMTYQVVWIRSLVLVVGSSTYALSAILSTFLLGIALGSAVFARFRRKNGPWLFALLQFGIAATAFLLVPAFDHLPSAFVSLARHVEGSFPRMQFLQFLVVSGVVLVPATLMGMTLPCVAGLVSRRVEDAGADFGTLYAYNTAGAILGTAAAGFLLIPLLGSQRTLLLCILAGAALGSLFAAAGTPDRRRRWLLLAPALCLGLFFLPGWDPREIASGAFNYVEHPPAPGEFLESIRSMEVVSVREGIHSTVAVTRAQDGTLSLLVNGKPDASNDIEDMETQVNLGYIPLLLHPDPRKVAVIGLGSGVTAAVAAAIPEPESIDVVELEPAVVAASAHFARENRDVLKDPRVRVHVEDGRNFLARSRLSFDVVISEPSNPWMAGIANLFTREFFSEVRARLSPDGVFCQWLQGYALSPDDMKMVVRTFLDAFPGGSLWLATTGDFLLVGRNGGAGPVDGDTIVRRVRENPGLASMSPDSSGHPLESLCAHFLLEGESLREFAGSGPRNTDDAPRLEFQAPKALLRDNPYPEMRREILGRKNRDFPSFLRHPALARPEAYLHMGEFLIGRGRYEEGVAAIGKASAMGVRRTYDWRAAGTSFPAPADRPDFLEDFDRKARVLPLFPRIGGFRPDDPRGADGAVWASGMHVFSGSSGIRIGAGRNGSGGLLVRNVPGISTVGFFSPLPVLPSRAYRVRFAMRCAPGEGGEAGVGYQEYDAVSPTGEQPGLDFTRKHLVDTRKGIRVTGQKDWLEYAFDFTTSPRTRMVHLLFYREGGRDRNPVAFDDVRVTEIGTGAVPGPTSHPAPGNR